MSDTDGSDAAPFDIVTASDAPPPPTIGGTGPALVLAVAGKSAISAIADGDWICEDVDCKNVNFARRTACNRCGRERILDAAARKKLGMEIGKAAAEKSRGLFSAEDWQCSKCANVNWARRNTCNMCNAPKFTDVEERTGYGGGYNDRGVVEYKEKRAASDDEYDEFGRRRKKRHESYSSKPEAGPNTAARSHMSLPADNPATNNTAEDDDDDEDDEEDDDDDADLSKYDLWGDDDETPAKSGNDSNKQNDKHSPSSSSTSSHSGSTSNSSRRRSRDRRPSSASKHNERKRSLTRSDSKHSSRRSRSRSTGRSRHGHAERSGNGRSEDRSRSRNNRSFGSGGRSRSRSRSPVHSRRRR